MPFILKLKHLSNQDISESLFLGGTTLSEQTSTSFTTQSGDITLHFTGKHLTYDAGGMITGGKIEEYRVYQGDIAIDTQIVIVNSSFTLLTGQMLAQVFAQYDSGDVAGANHHVMHNWIAEGIDENDYSLDDLHGTHGDDYLFTGLGPNTVTGLAGNDVIQLGQNGGLGYGGTGDDFLYAHGGFDSVYGGQGNDRLFGSYARHDQSGDLLSGGSGDDLITGRRGFDTLIGGTGDDVLSMGGSASGGAGNDSIFGGRQAGSQVGGMGDDLIKAGGGVDQLIGGAQSDQLFGQRGDDMLFGGHGNDVLRGGAGDDRMYGSTDNDHEFGGLGADLLSGGSGHDRLAGGEGSNGLFGGDGRDGFVFAPHASTDTIFDFQLGRDHLNLHGFHFADLAAVSALLTDTGTGDAQFDFGGGQTLLVHGVSAVDLLADVVL